MLVDSDFALTIYIPQHDKDINREFNFMNVGFFIAANVWGMSKHKLSSNINRLYISKCHRSRAEKKALKWTQNELHYSKSNSCHVIRGYIFLRKYICTCFTMTPRVTVNIIWRKPMIPGTSWKFEHKRMTKPRCLMQAISMKKKICPK